MDRLPKRRKHRLPAAIYARRDYSYSFTVCARHQGTPFTNRDLAAEVISSLLWTRAEHDWWLYCYCLMPDHLHFVCGLKSLNGRIVSHGARGSEIEGVLDHVARFKSYTTQRSWPLGIVGQLWQRSSYDKVFDLDRPFEAVVQYVLDNPVRKGLVKQSTEWPHARVVDRW